MIESEGELNEILKGAALSILTMKNPLMGLAYIFRDVPRNEARI